MLLSPHPHRQAYGGQAAPTNIAGRRQPERYGASPGPPPKRWPNQQPDPRAGQKSKPAAAAPSALW